MAERETTILDWNIPNWVTVTLMVAVGYLVIALFVSVLGGKGVPSWLPTFGGNHRAAPGPAPQSAAGAVPS